MEIIRNDANLLTPDDLFEITLFFKKMYLHTFKQEGWDRNGTD
jgi:hypothetical protein